MTTVHEVYDDYGDSRLSVRFSDSDDAVVFTLDDGTDSGLAIRFSIKNEEALSLIEALNDLFGVDDE